MNLLTSPKVDTTGWSDKVHQHPLPDWKNIPTEVDQRGKKWSQNPADRPWFDQDYAADQVASLMKEGLITDDEVRLLLQWIDEGYFVLEKAIVGDDFALLDEYVKGVDDVWTTERELNGLQISGLHINGVKQQPIAHAKLISWPLEDRLRLRDTETWRIHYYQPYTPAGLKLAQSDKLMRFCTLILQNNPVLLNLTTYKYSSEVALHQDMWFYHLHPANHMVGVWLACEDVFPDTGPLAVYPRSHKIPMWPGYNNYPQTNYRTCRPEAHEQIQKYLGGGVAGTKRVSLPIKKGDAIFLSGLNVHDADKVEQRGLKSRFSIVYHYATPGVNRFNEVEGPFNY
jgi:hypothetical protein